MSRRKQPKEYNNTQKELYSTSLDYEKNFEYQKLDPDKFFIKDNTQKNNIVDLINKPLTGDSSIDVKIREAQSVASWAEYQAMKESETEYKKLFSTTDDKLDHNIYGYLSPELKKQEIANNLKKKYLESFEENGSIKEDVLYDPEFFNRIDNDTFTRLARAKNDIENKWNITLGWKESRDIQQARDEFLKDKDLDKYLKSVSRTIGLYSNTDNSHALRGASGILYNMKHAFEQNPKEVVKTIAETAMIEATGTAMAGSVAPFVGTVTGGILGATMGTIHGTYKAFKLGRILKTYATMSMFNDSYKQSTIDIMLNASEDLQGQLKQERPQWTNEQINDELKSRLTKIEDSKTTKIASAFYASLDTSAYAIGYNLFASPTKKLLTNFFKGATQEATRATEQAVANATEKAVNSKLQKLMGARFGYYVKGVGANTLLETGTEIVQDSSARVASDLQVGKSTEQIVENVEKQITETAQDVLSPIALLSGVMGVPRLFVSRTRFNAIDENAEQIVTQTVTDESLQQAQTDLNLMDKVLSSNDTGYEVNATYARNNLSDEQLSKLKQEHQDIYNRFMSAREGDFVNLSHAEWNKLNEYQETILEGTTVKDGEYTVDNTNSEELLQEEIQLNNDIREQSEQVNLEAQELRSVRDEFFNQLTENTYLNAEQRKVISEQYSSYFYSLAKTLNVSIKTLFDKYKPQIKNLIKTTSLENNAETINKDDVNATYQSNTNTIQIKNGGDFNSVLHESLHFFLNTLKQLSSTNDKAKQMFNDLAQWALGNENINADNITNEQLTELQEKFVWRYIIDSLNGSKHATKNKVKSFLLDVRNASLYKKLANVKQATTEQKIKHVTKGVEDTYNFTLPQSDELFNNVVNELFTSAVESETNEQDYRTHQSELNDVIDNSELSEEEKTKTKEELNKAIQENQEYTRNILEQYHIKRALLMSVANKSVDSIVNYVTKKIKANSKLNTFISKLHSAQKKYNRLVQDIKNETRKSLDYQTYTDLKDLAKLGIKISIDELNLNSLSTFQQWKIKDLIRKGVLVKGSGESLFKQVKNAIGMETLNKETLDKINKFNTEQEKAVVYISTLYNMANLDRYARRTARNYVVNEYTQALSEELVGDINTDIAERNKRLGINVLKTIHTLTKRTSESTKVLVKQLERLAHFDIDNLNYKELKPLRYARNSRHANGETAKALIRGEMEKALHSARVEVYQAEKYKYSNKTKTQIDKDLKNLVKFINKGKSYFKKNKNYDYNMIDLMRTLTYRVGLSDKMPERDLETIKRDLLEQYQELSNSFFKPTFEMIENLKGHYSEKSVREVKQIIKSLKQIKTLAHDVKTIKQGTKRILIEEFVEQFLNATQWHKNKRKSNRTKNGVALSERNNLFKGWTTAIKSYLSNLRIFDKFCKQLDGKMNGFCYNNLYMPIKNAVSNYRYANKQYIQKLTKLFADSGFQISSNEIVCDGVHAPRLEGIDNITGENVNVTFKNENELFGFMLHTGTNLSRLIDSYLWCPSELQDDVQARLDYKTRAFNQWLKAMIDQGIITKNMLDLCQSIWDIGDDIGQQVQRTAIEQNSVPFTELENRTFIVDFPNGEKKTYTAKYMPAIVNLAYDRINKNKSKSLANTLMEAIDRTFNNQRQVNLTQPSFIQERAIHNDMPLELDYSVLLQSLVSDELKYIHITPSVVNIHKIIMDDRVHTRLNDIAPKCVEEYFIPYLSEIQNLQSREGVLPFRIFNIINSRFQSATMIGNVINTAQQASNLFMLANTTGYLNVIKAIGHFIVNPRRMREELEKLGNKALYNRLNSENDFVSTIFEEFRISPKNYSDFKGKSKAIAKLINTKGNRMAYWLQTHFQYVLDEIGHRSAIFHAQEMREKNAPDFKDMTDEQIVEYGNDVIRDSFSSMDFEDLPQLSRQSIWLKSFSVFTNWFIFMLQDLHTQLKIAEKNMHDNNIDITNCYRLLAQPFFYKMMFRLTTTAYIVPIVAKAIELALVGDLRGNDDKRKERVKRMLTGEASIQQIFTAFPIVGKLMYNFVDEKIYGVKAYYTNAFFSNLSITSVTNALNAMQKLTGLKDKEFEGKDIRALSYLVSTALGLGDGVLGLALIGRYAGIIYDGYYDNIKLEDSIDYMLLSLSNRPGERMKNK